MKKEMMLLFIMSSISMAMDEPLADKKRTSTIPTNKIAQFCCLRNGAVPPCDRCFEKGILSMIIEKKSSYESQSSSACQVKRACP